MTLPGIMHQVKISIGTWNKYASAKPYAAVSFLENTLQVSIKGCKDLSFVENTSGYFSQDRNHDVNICSYNTLNQRILRVMGYGGSEAATTSYKYESE
jgi:mRNA deadenylase 3'-5' endonuclease subunit Ccr4